jgi:hypothetical protein
MMTGPERRSSRGCAQSTDGVRGARTHSSATSLRPLRSIRNLPLAVALLLSGAGPLHAQNPDLILSQAERDTILKNYHNIFPIFGRQAIERGFDLAKPFGINAAFMYVDQGIEIGNLGLSTGDNPTVPIGAISFGDNRSTVSTANIRGDLWVFPFLNVYAMGGAAKANTTVEVATPVAFESSVDQTGDYFGMGLTGAFGIKRYFAVADMNWTWSSFEKLDEVVRGRVLSFRFGRTLKLGSNKRLSYWVGAMNMRFATETNGSIMLSEVIPPGTSEAIRDRLENIEDSEWYQGLDPAQKAVVDQLVERLLNREMGDVKVNYGIEKAPTDPWNMIIGGNLDLSKRWSIRTEFGVIDRFSFLLSPVYRLDF